ncbi:MAG: M48 family metallopeptidase [Rhodanobacteraceae bacterium]|nr:M48 family metallopeptidase [Rhodanobacteraceae bacterium]
MIWANGYLYDGISSAQTQVRFGVDAPGRLLIEHAEGVEIVGPAESVRVDTRVANIRRTLKLADGRQIHSDDNDAIDGMFAARAGFEALVHLLESRWQIALASVFATVVAALLLFWFGVSWAADQAAQMVPIEWERAAGTQTLSALETMGFRPSELPEQRQQQLRAAFERFVSELPEKRDYQLEFRDWLGPNAFALPGGTVVFTDDIVLLCANDDEFLAILAHEIGHLEHRHVMRTVMRGASIAVLTAVVFGDVGSASSLIIAVPTTLVYSAYSREFESEADDYAFTALKRRGKSALAFAAVMGKLEAAVDKINDGEDDDTWSYLSSHPDTQERIEAAKRASLR